jgi:hypothetical protein
MPISSTRKGPGGTACGSSTCVDVKRSDDGVTLTSTIDGNDGTVTYTHAEWNAFGKQVKNGEWDHTFDA